MKKCIICTVGIPEGADCVVRNGHPAHLSCYERPDDKVVTVALSFIDAVREAIVETAGRFPIAYHLPAEGDDIPTDNSGAVAHAAAAVRPAFGGYVSDPAFVEAAKDVFDRGIVDPAVYGFDTAYKDKPYPYDGGKDVVDEGPSEGVNYPGHEAVAPSTFPPHSPSTLSMCRICDTSIYRLTATSTEWKHTKAFQPNPDREGALTAPGGWCIPEGMPIPEPTPNVYTQALAEMVEDVPAKRGGLQFGWENGKTPDHPFQPAPTPAGRAIIGEDEAGLIVEPIVEGKHRADKRTPSADDRAEPVLGTTDHRSHEANCNWCGESIYRRADGLSWRHTATHQTWCIPRYDDGPDNTQHACARCSCVVSTSDAVSVDGSLYHRQCQDFA